VRSRRRRIWGSWWCERQHLGWPAAAGQLLGQGRARRKRVIPLRLGWPPARRDQGRPRVAASSAGSRSSSLRVKELPAAGRSGRRADVPTGRRRSGHPDAGQAPHREPANFSVSVPAPPVPRSSRQVFLTTHYPVPLDPASGQLSMRSCFVTDAGRSGPEARHRQHRETTRHGPGRQGDGNPDSGKRRADRNRMRGHHRLPRPGQSPDREEAHPRPHRTAALLSSDASDLAAALGC
jgi:hypothetical protein